MAYGLKYICTFDNLRLDIPADPEFTVEFLFKDYTGEAYNVMGASGVIKHSYDTDDPHATIKGSSLTITLINVAQSLPITSFLSLEDDGVKVRLIRGGSALFEGFLVQDDCIEPLLDTNHEITLTATDNLGLLKNVALDVALRATITSFQTNIEGIAPNQIRMVQSSGSTIDIGDILVITGSSLNGTYTVTNKILFLGSRIFTVAESVSDVAIGPATITQQRGDLYQLVTLLTIIKACLGQTGIFLATNIYANIAEITHDPDLNFLEQTLINPQTFNKGNDIYEDCYTVLEKILKRFNMTVFQATGLYNLVRWGELSFYNNLIHGWIYDEDFNYVGPVLGDLFLNAPIDIGVDEDLVWLSAPDHRIFRPYLYDQETFLYKQPANLLRNYNLQNTGNLLRAYTDGSGDDLHYVNEYEALYWSPLAGSYVGSPEYYIRVVTDAVGNELGRRMVVINGAIISTPIEASLNDRFTFSFTVITNATYPGNVNVIFEVALTDGTDTVYLHEDGTWQSTSGWTVNVPASDNANISHTYSFTGQAIPFDGLLTFSLEDYGAGAFETQYTDIRLDYVFTINESAKVIGHVHTSSQGGVIKLNEEEEIFIDSTSRNSIAGTLFLDEKNGLLQARTTLWSMPGGATHNLGEITTSETLNWRRYPRSIIEGTFKTNSENGLYTLPANISVLNTIKYNYFPDKNFVWGRLEIDYRNNTMSGTLWEMWRDAEEPMAYNYVFKYLYDIK